MKRLLILLLLIPFTLVKAEEDSKEKIIIENAEYNYVQYDNGTFEVKEKYNLSQVFSINTKGNYFEKKFYTEYTNKYLNNRKFEYSYNYGDMSEDMIFSIFTEKGNDVIRLDSQSEVLKEKITVNIKYKAVPKNANEKSIYLVVGNNRFETNELLFSMYIFGGYNNKIVLYSIDGENYSESIEGLNTTIVGGEILQGTYEKKLSPNTGLHVLITEESEISAKTGKEGTFDIMIPIYIVLGVLFISFVFVILSKKKKVTKQ